MQTIPLHDNLKFKNQRGAALITTLLISALLLTAGGMLIITTTMAGINTIDAAAETQAYYGAEAGIQASLNVLRGNVLPNPLFVPNPPGTVAPQNRMTFTKALTKTASNLATDPSALDPRLSRWLTYNYESPGSGFKDRVAISPGYNPFNGIAYSIVIAPVNGGPRRLIIHSTGYGPRGARKKLSLLVSANGLDITVPATLTLRGHDDGVTSANIDLGSSNSETYSGIDNSGVESLRPTLAVNDHDVDIAEAAFESRPDNFTDPKFKVLDLPGEPAPVDLAVDPPWYLETANNARTFLAQAEALALKKGRVVNSLNGAAGSISLPEFVFVKGNCHLESGAGLLIVTGKLTTSGNPGFHGTILVLGSGEVYKSGGGGGNTLGSITVAKFGATGGFLAPIFNVSGGGNSNLQFDSTSYEESLALTTPKVLGMVERYP
jgi:hypothetical protein